MNRLRGIVAFTFIVFHTVFWCALLYSLALVRLVIPRALGKRHVDHAMTRIIDGWVACNRALVRMLRLSDIRVTLAPDANLSRASWYLVVSNHQSWTDIIVLQNSLAPHIPPLKFFTKQELIWVPFVGFAMWLLGFPYVRRLSREQLAARPELRGRDREATLKACEGFKQRPTTVLNFLEGTRFTHAKHAAQESPYAHLLRPKIGGLGYVAEALGEHVEQVVDVTILYPGERAPTFWEFLCGDCREVHVEITPHGKPDPFHAPAHDDGRSALRDWVETLWARKDARLNAHKS